jgi:hypothetical protein
MIAARERAAWGFVAPALTPIHVTLGLFVQVRDGTLVLAAGLPMRWIDSMTGVGVRDIRPAGARRIELR